MELAKINGLEILDLLKDEIKQNSLEIKSFYKQSFWKNKNNFNNYDSSLLYSKSSKNNILRYIFSFGK